MAIALQSGHGLGVEGDGMSGENAGGLGGDETGRDGMGVIARSTACASKPASKPRKPRKRRTKPAAMVHPSKRPHEKPSDSSDLDKRRALWESVSVAEPPQYPRGTPLFDPHPPIFPITRDPVTLTVPKTVTRSPIFAKAALDHLIIPGYRSQPLVQAEIVPRETPEKPKLWFAPDINPNECRYRYIRAPKGLVICRVTHQLTGISARCAARTSLRAARNTAEFRLVALLREKRESLGTEYNNVIWIHEMKRALQAKRRSLLPGS